MDFRVPFVLDGDMDEPLNHVKTEAPVRSRAVCACLSRYSVVISGFYTATIPGCGGGCDVWYNPLVGPILGKILGFAGVSLSRLTGWGLWWPPDTKDIGSAEPQGFGFTCTVGYLPGDWTFQKVDWLYNLICWVEMPMKEVFFHHCDAHPFVKSCQKVGFIGGSLVWGVSYKGAILKLNDPDLLFSCRTTNEMDWGYHQSENAQNVLIQIRSHCKLHF